MDSSHYVVRLIFGLDVSEDISDTWAMESHAAIIRNLGGGTALASALCERHGPIDREAVYKWQTNGIPWKWRTAVAALAGEAGVPIPDDFLQPVSKDEQQPRPQTGRVA